MHEVNHVATFVPDPDPITISSYCMQMTNEATHQVTGHALNLRQLLRDAAMKTNWDNGKYDEYGRLWHGHKRACVFINHSDVPKG
jgi:hypothetical protein